MITADPQIDDVKNALKLGAYDFVGKPLDFEELRVTIQMRWRPPGCAPKSSPFVAKFAGTRAITRWLPYPRRALN